MAIVADRVREISTTTGTGTLTLAGAGTGFRTFSDAFATNDAVYYTIVAVDAGGVATGAWEVGIGTFTEPNLLSRDTVLSSSNSGSLVNFAAGTKDVFCTIAATLVNSLSPADGVNIISAGSQQAGTHATVMFSNSNGITFGMSNSSVITGSVRTDYQSSGNYLTTAMLSNAATLSNIKISAGTSSTNLSALTFSDGSGISFGLNGSVLTGSVKTDYQTSGAYLTTAMLSNAATISNIKVSAGTSSTNLSALTFSDGSGISFGLNGSVMTASVKTDYQTSGAYLTTAMLSNAATISNIKVSAGTSSTNLSAITFSDSNSVSFGLNGSVITASYAPRVSYIENFQAGNLQAAAQVQGTLFFQRMYIPFALSATEADLVMLISNSANAAGTLSMQLGLYSFSNSSKAVTISTTQRAFSYNSTQAASSYTHVSGTRYRSFALGAGWNITPGEYMLACEVSIVTGLTSGTYSYYGAGIPAIRPEEFAGGDHIRYFGRGVYSVQTNACPDTVHISDINQTGGAAAGAMPWLQFAG